MQRISARKAVTQSAPSSGPGRCRCACTSPQQRQEEFAEVASSVSVLMTPLLYATRLQSSALWIAVLSSSSLGSRSMFSPRTRLVIPSSEAVQVRQPDVNTSSRCSVRSAALGKRITKEIQHGASAAPQKSLPWHPLLSSLTLPLFPLFSQIFTLFLHRLRRTRRRQFIYLYNSGFM